MKPQVPASAVHAAHVLHGYVQKAEAVSHATYLGMVSFGSHDYHLAAAAMLFTVVIGAALHILIALGHE